MKNMVVGKKKTTMKGFKVIQSKKSNQAGIK